MTSRKAQYVLSIVDNGNSASSCTTSDNDLFLSEIVGYSTDIAMLITAFLICMSVLAGQEAPSHTGCLARSEQGSEQQIDGKVYPLIEGFKLRVG